MDDNAQGILVLAIAKHGIKLATSDSYCQVYLAGYMADYPLERRLLASLRNLDLPKALIAYLKNEIREPDLKLAIGKLKQNRLFKEADLAWGIDAWADALLVPEIVRKHIRRTCFSFISEPLNTDQKLASTRFNSKAFFKKEKRSKAWLPLTTMIFFTFMTSQLADGYTSSNNLKGYKPSSTKKPKVAYNPITAVPIKQSSTTALKPKPTEPQNTQATLSFVNFTKAPRQRLNQATNLKRIQKNKRLQANVEAFLKYQTPPEQ